MASDKYKRKEFEWIFSLQHAQKTMLKGKDSALSELYGICDNQNQRNLLKDLIIRFNCFDEEVYNLALIEITNFVACLGYDPKKTAIVALCHDSLADSSQVVLNDLKIYINNKTGISVFINRFDKIVKHYKTGIRFFIAVDEFIGSGQTINNRYDEFNNKKLIDAKINFCIIAGMKDAIDICKPKGIELYVTYIMEKGISGYYSGTTLSAYIYEMNRLEQNLARFIDQTHLIDYKFGYKKSEALYSRLNKNIPNNSFPIFWWKMNKESKNRLTLFDRVQDGY